VALCGRDRRTVAPARTASPEAGGDAPLRDTFAHRESRLGPRSRRGAGLLHREARPRDPRGRDAPRARRLRWLTVGAVGQPDVAFTLNVPGPPLFDPATTEQVKEVIAKGGAGSFIFGTDNCRADYEELKGRGVEFTEEPSERPYGIDAGFRDPSGNSFRLVQNTMR
jgi:Glyoxalase/Bleomycin resistance protein/Dioxygenase superfamily